MKATTLQPPPRRKKLSSCSKKLSSCRKKPPSASKKPPNLRFNNWMMIQEAIRQWVSAILPYADRLMIIYCCFHPYNQ